MKDQRNRLIVGTLLSLLLLLWVFWRTDWGKVIERLQSAELSMLVLAFLLAVINIVLRAWRWGIMLEPEEPTRPFMTLFDIVNLGYLANNLLPARLGDLLRAYLAGEWTKASLAFALSTTVVERVLDTLVVVLMLFGVLPFLPVPSLAARTGLLVGGVLFVAGCLLVAAAWQRQASERLLRRLLRPLPLDEGVWGERLVALLDGFALVRQPARFARVLLATALIWAVAIASYWATFQAFHLSELGPPAAAFTISLAALGMAAPSGPAAAGTYHAAATGALELLNVPAGLPGGIALVLHAINFTAITALGLWTMGRRGLSLGALRSRTKEIEQLNA